MALNLRRGLSLPAKFLASAAELASRPLSPELERALPDSKGGETPKDLQRHRTDMFELFTSQIGVSQLFYSADQWVRVQLMLETAGPVAVSTRSDIVPVLSGKGRILVTNIPVEIVVPKGARLYYAAASINRIAITIEPIPWMEQISGEIRAVTSAIAGGLAQVVQAITGRVQAPTAPPPAVRGAAPKLGTRIQRLTKLPPTGKIR